MMPSTRSTFVLPPLIQHWRSHAPLLLLALLISIGTVNSALAQETNTLGNETQTSPLFALTHTDLSALWLTLKLAGCTTLILMGIGLPLAWWLAHTHSRWQSVIATLVALPLVLPPTVLGFYLLQFLGPSGTGGSITHALGLGYLPFTFWGLVLASCIYSLPFVVQPLQASFANLNPHLIESAATLGAKPRHILRAIVLPLCRRGFIAASVLGFAHTVGEFGVVLMMGGNIPGNTQVLSVLLYEHVEAMEYGSANALALLLVIFSFVVLMAVYWKTSPNVLASARSNTERR